MDLLNLFVKVVAQDEASSEIESISSNIIGKLGNAASTAAKALAALWATSKVVEFGKQAFQAYSQFEQLEGGVAKLYGNANMELEEYAQSVGKAVDEVAADYQRNAEAQKMVMENAQQAWKTAGMDANTYMETATSFSASLINSLGGDTREAARLTDEAMKAMSDNVNTFGSDMGSVQNAFQGFAKQNWTMLDNLKLGYGGTKSEMERLIKDASLMTKEQEQLNMTVDGTSLSFDNVVKAIQVVQKHQGIYGTTAKEALNTIEGSMNATKAAWQNLIAEVGKPDADLGARIRDMMTAIMGESGEGGLLRNVANEVKTIVTNVVGGISNLATQGFDWLVTNGPKVVSDAFGKIRDALYKAGSDLMNMYKSGDAIDIIGGMFGTGEEITGKVIGLFQGIGDAIVQGVPDILTGLQYVAQTLGMMVQEYGPAVLEKIGEILGNIGTFLVENLPEFATIVSEALMGFLEWLTSKGPEFAEKFVEVVGNVMTAAWEWIRSNGPTIVETVREIILGVIGAIMEHAPTIVGNIMETLGRIVVAIVAAIPDVLSAAVEFMGGLITGTSEEGEKLRKWFSELPGKLLKAMGDVGHTLVNAGREMLNGFWDGMGEVADGIFSWVSGIADQIASLKGPLPYDRKVLVDNGLALMTGLQKGLKSGFEDKVMPYVASMAEEMQKGVSLDLASPTYSIKAVDARQQQQAVTTVRDDAVIGILTAILNAIPEEVTLDSRALVGALAPDMNRALGAL